MASPLLPLLLLYCISAPLASAKVRHFKWEVGYIYWSADCEERLMIGINGRFPGPTVRARTGDTIVVEVKNSLPTEGVSIHWHGIRQLGTPWFDGTASISQCAINPAESFVYRFEVGKAGTYMYHGHYGMQRAAGLYGSLIVEAAAGEEPFHYDGELNLLLSDWWHASALDQMAGLSSRPFRWIGEAQHHKMTVVEADGNYVEPFSVDDMDIYSGESYSVLITTNQNPTSNYWISAGVRGRLPKTQPALAILNYHHNSASNAPPTASPPITPTWNDYNHSKSFTYKIRGLPGTPRPPRNPDRRIALLNTQSKINGYTKWSINNISLVLPTTPYLGSMRYGFKNAFDAEEPSDNFPKDYEVMKPPTNPNSTQSSRVYKLEFNSTVDVILQNANALLENVSEIHPWHLHGHDFWILGYGDGRFSEKDMVNLNLKNPPLRNTVVIFPYGWTAIRFVADNPGVWAFHCHIEPHLHMGMGIIFAEGVELLGKLLNGAKLPNGAVACGISGKMLMKEHLP